MHRTAANHARLFRRRTTAPPGNQTSFATLFALWAVVYPATSSAAPPAVTPRVAEETPHPGEPAAGYRWARGWIVRVNGSEVVIDLGTADGLRRGQELALYRTVKARHPRTGKELVDRFVAGLCPVLDVATHLSLLKPDKELLAQLAEGDLVECQVPAPSPAAAAMPVTAAGKQPAKPSKAAMAGSGAKDESTEGAAAGTCPPATPCPPCPSAVSNARAGATPDEVALDEAFQNSLGRTPAERIALWRDWLRRFPSSSHADAVVREVAAMHEQSANMRAARADAERLTQLTSAGAGSFTTSRITCACTRRPGWYSVPRIGITSPTFGCTCAPRASRPTSWRALNCPGHCTGDYGCRRRWLPNRASNTSSK